jgi:hypothetical protein
VEVLDAETNLPTNSGPKYLSQCFDLNSAWVLMNSATDVWPDGLGSSSGELGHNLMDHHQEVGAGGDVDGYEDKYYYGRRANGIYIPQIPQPILATVVITCAVLAIRVERSAEKATITRWRNTASEKNTKRH